MCLVGEECELCYGAWRNSGDVAFRDSATGHVYIIGRIDRQIKRKGHRVNMDHVQQVHTHTCSTLEPLIKDTIETDSFQGMFLKPPNIRLFSNTFSTSKERTTFLQRTM